MTIRNQRTDRPRSGSLRSSRSCRTWPRRGSANCRHCTWGRRGRPDGDEACLVLPKESVGLTVVTWIFTWHSLNMLSRDICCEYNNRRTTLASVGKPVNSNVCLSPVYLLFPVVSASQKEIDLKFEIKKRFNQLNKLRPYSQTKQWAEVTC